MIAQKQLPLQTCRLLSFSIKHFGTTPVRISFRNTYKIHKHPYPRRYLQYSRLGLILFSFDRRFGKTHISAAMHKTDSGTRHALPALSGTHSRSGKAHVSAAMHKTDSGTRHSFGLSGTYSCSGKAHVSAPRIKSTTHAAPSSGFIQPCQDT